MNPMSTSFDLTPQGTKMSANMLTKSLDMGRRSKGLIQVHCKKIKTPSFTASECGDKKRSSDLLLKHKEVSVIEPIIHLQDEEIVQPNEIEYYSHHDGSPGNSPYIRTKAGNLVTTV